MQNEFEIRTNNAGEPDMDFYIQEAYALRHQVVAAGFSRLAKGTKNAIVKLLTLELNIKRPVSFGTLLGH